MQNLTIEYSFQNLSLREKKPKIAWVSETGIIEWSTKDFPQYFPVGKMLEWVLYQKILDHLDQIIIEFGPKLERLKYFKSPFRKLSPSLDFDQRNDIRALIEYRLPDDFDDFSIELQDLNLGLHLTELSRFYLYFANHLPQMTFSNLSDHSAKVLLSKDDVVMTEWYLPYVFGTQRIEWIVEANDSDKKWITKLKECFECDDANDWSYFENGFDLFILSNKYWSIWIQGDLTRWEIALICINLLSEIYPCSKDFNQIESLITSRCCPWPQSKVEVNLS